MYRRVASLLFWLFMVASSLLLFPVALCIWAATVLFDRKLVLLHRFTCFWASLYTWLNPAWRVRIEGREKIRPRTTYVMVANHQSLLDILVLFRLFAHFKWVSKIENFRVPVIGWNMSLNRYIKLRRGDTASIDRDDGACERTIREGNSIMMFPEGAARPTATAPVQARRLHPGAENRRRAPPHHRPRYGAGAPETRLRVAGRHAIRISVLDEIPHDHFADKPVEHLTEEVRCLIASRLEQSPPA